MSAPHVDTLIQQVQHGTELDACEASKLLADVPGEYVVTELSRVLRFAENPYSREAAAYALSWHRDSIALVPLLECAGDPREQDVIRGQAIEGLAMHLGDDGGRPEVRLKTEDLMISLLQSPSLVLRFWSCYGLGVLKCERAVPFLSELSKPGPDVCPGWWYIHEEAEDALERIAGRAGADRIPVHSRNATGPQ